VLTDWMHWLSSIPTDIKIWMCLPFLLFDGTRYTLALGLMCLYDCVLDAARWSIGRQEEEDWSYCPTVAVMIVGLNEGATIQHALESVWNTYPRMEIFVVDDGSSDDMSKKANQFARHHRSVTVLRRKKRGGKSSAMNMPLPMITSEIVVVLDSDSHLSDGAIWQLVRPFTDPRVAAVSGNVQARNPFVNLCTRLQALEYRRSIFVGRMLLARLGILGIVSGALGAFRKSALDRFGGWDVGPGEDGDLTIKFRKAGYKIAYVPAASCLTNVPNCFARLTQQRRRWEWAAITFECRKHVDMGNPFSKNFRWDNFAMMMERWSFNVVFVYLGAMYWVWILTSHPFRTICFLTITFYLIYVVCELLQNLVVLYYSDTRWQDTKLFLMSPWMPFYYSYQKFVTLFAITEEIFTRRSFRDNFVPSRVRRSTWHW
jgi:biofilm PGA synthesis N-glycosyltransferase PgaC